MKEVIAFRGDGSSFEVGDGHELPQLLPLGPNLGADLIVSNTVERNTRLALGAGGSLFRVGGATVFLPLRGPVAVSPCGRELSSWLGFEKMHTAAGWLP